MVLDKVWSVNSVIFCFMTYYSKSIHYFQTTLYLEGDNALTDDLRIFMTHRRSQQTFPRR